MVLILMWVCAPAPLVAVGWQEEEQQQQQSLFSGAWALVGTKYWWAAQHTEGDY